MRNFKYVFVGMLMPLMLASCFSDEGNYEYESLKPPTWLDNFMNRPIQVLVYGGRNVKLDGSRYFNWGKLDSLQRSQEVRYEWRMNGKVFSDQLKEEMTTDEFLKRMGLEEMPVKEQSGDFSIIEKSSGVTFKVKCTLFFKPAIGGGDFVVYSAKSPTETNVGKLTVFRLVYINEKGRLKQNYDFGRYVLNDIPGTPKTLDVAVAKNVGAAGSLTVITEEGDATVYNAGNLKKEWELSSQFADGIPDNFKVSGRKDQEDGGLNTPASTWVVTKDGRLFSRQFGKNYLGGKFLSEPYYIDSLGYKITKFGHTNWGVTNIPCYDEKNRRVVLATSVNSSDFYKYRSFVATLHSNQFYSPAEKMPADAKVYYLTTMNGAEYRDNRNSWFQAYYTTQGKSMVACFAVDNYGRRLTYTMNYMSPYEVPGHLFTDETVFLTASGEHLTGSSSKAYTDLFSEGKDLYAIERDGNRTYFGASEVTIRQIPLEGITSKITCMVYDVMDYWMGLDGEYPHLVVGCENGDVLIYYAVPVTHPRLMKKYNVGGRVSTIKQVAMPSGYLDLY
ncbi:MAG: PKD-like family lipoprotein [Hoylesella shahii]|uniref:PKD-like family lipoprotein n=1 Tax=Hoylesella shahii TaxID=228603 RepID=UPI0028D40BA2|nr:PKD-like family lipoprotein [Hoylesella shahii]